MTTNQPLTKHDIEKAKTKPPIPFPQLDWIPQSMRDRNQWVLWNYVLTKDQRWTKVLYELGFDEYGNLSLLPASSTDPDTWTSFDRLFTHYLRGCEAGLGFVLSADDPFCAIDLDDCRNKLTGAITPEAQAIIDRFHTYTEISPSGTGVKIYFRGRKPGTRCRGRGIEIYDQKRFLAVTGDLLPGMPEDLMDRQEELDSLYHELFPQTAPSSRSTRNIDDQAGQTPPPIQPSTLWDSEILERASRAKNGYKFDRLWRGDTSDYGGDRSSADFALAMALAFWVGPDAGRIESLMMQSGLRRAKWTERKDYLPRTIEAAINKQTTWYDASRGHLPQPDALLTLEVEDEESHQSNIDRIVQSMIAGMREAKKERAEDEARTKDNVARAVAQARADQHRYHRPNCRPILMRAKTVSPAALQKPYVIWARCQSWVCAGCRCWMILRERAAAEIHFRQAESLHEFGCTDEQWEGMRKRIRRAKGEYLRIRDGEGWYVVTSAPVRGSIPVTADMACSVVRTLLEAWEGEHRPITTSRGWCLLKEESELDLERVGMCHPSLTPNDVAQIAQAFDATVQTRAADPTRPSHVVLTLRVVRNTGWDALAFDRFAASLYAGHVVHRELSTCRDVEIDIDPGRVSSWASTIAQDLGLSL